jgi:hypothetical protein
MMRAWVLLLAVVAAAHSQGVPTCQCAPPLVTGDPPCCTYTIGWWGNHHKYKPQQGPQWIPWPTTCPGPLDAGEDSIVFGGLTALTVLKTPPKKGDMCYILGHQFIAATMNECKGACTDATVSQALLDAWALLTTPGLCPGGLEENNGNQTLRAQAEAIKNILDDYNNGLNYGPGHCDDEAPPECPEYDCFGGCTWTPGYWGTHNSERRGKQNMPWGEIEGCPHSETTIIYDSVTWLDALTTPPQGGNACLIAARHYVAARLNIDCNDACIPQLFVADALTCVAGKLNSTYCPGLTPGNGPLTPEEKAVRAELLTCARTLDAYNNGFLLGPGNCDTFEEDNEEGGGNGNGPKSIVEGASASSETLQDTGVSIATLVMVALILAGVIIILFLVRTYTNFKMGRRTI